MSGPSTLTTLTSLTATNALKHDNFGFKFQQTVPSDILPPSKESSVSRVASWSSSGSAYSTLRGSRNRKSYAMVEKESLPEGWRRVEHPSSGVYYFNKEKSLSTPSNMLDREISANIMESADALRQSKAMQALPKEVHLVLAVQSGNGSGSAGTMCYYCVSHTERDIFWLEDVGQGLPEVSCTSPQCPKGSRGHCIQAQYWKHCELFPTTLTVTRNIISKLKNVLLQASADRLLVKFSTSPYDKDHLAYMLNLVEKIGDEEIRNRSASSDVGSLVAYPDVEEGSGHSAWIIARFMALYIDGVLESSFGLESDDFFDHDNTGQIIEPYKRHLLLTILTIPFIKTPNVFAFELHSFRKDFTLTRWSDFVRKVEQNIRDSNLLATVLLGTNMGFLSWCRNNGVTDFNNPNASQIVSYISIICSVGSILTGLAIFKQYRATGADTPLRAVVVLRRILKEWLGLERLAIVCSLPYVLLMWSLIAFLASFAIIFYQNTGIGVRIPVTLALFVVLFFLCFSMYTAVAHCKEDQEPRKTASKSKAVADEEKQTR